MVHYLTSVRILIADGDRRTVSFLRQGLSEAGHTVDVALNGEHALWHGHEFDYDAVVLDLTLPGMDGIQVGLKLRERKPATSILMLVTSDDLSVRKAELRAVTDVLIVKPIELAHLTARLSAVNHLDPDPAPPELHVADLRMSPATRQAWRGDIELNLSPREFNLLELFLTHCGEVLNRRQILETVWARSHDKAPNLVDQYVLYLRRKIDRPFGVHQLETVRGAGYRLREHPTPAASPGYPRPGADPTRDLRCVRP